MLGDDPPVMIPPLSAAQSLLLLQALFSPKRILLLASQKGVKDHHLGIFGPGVCFDLSCVVQHPVIYSVFSVNTKQEEKQRNSRRQNRAERPMEEKERREEREKVCTAQVGPQPRQDNNAKGNETK